MDYIRQHKEFFVAAAIGVVVLASLYISAMFRPGVWYQGEFLYQQSEGVFEGQTMSLELQPTSEGARAVFRVGEDSRQYRLTTTTPMTEIFEEGRLQFRGTVRPQGEGFQFLDQRGEPVPVQSRKDGFPDFRQIYTWAMEGQHDHRGHSWVLGFVGVLAVLLGADLLWPDLAAKLARGRMVKDGKPTAYFRLCQKIGNWILAGAIAFFLYLGFH